MSENTVPVALCFPPEPRPHYRWNEAWKSEPSSRELFEMAEAAILQRSVSEVSIAQVQLFTVSVASARMVREALRAEPAFAVPHSVGLYAALVDTGVWSFEQGLDYTITAGEFIHDFTRNGGFGMAAVLGFCEDTLRRMCSEIGDGTTVQMVGHNAPRFSTIAGDKDATKNIIDRVLAEGATDARFLPSPAPLHTSLVEGIRDRLREYIRGWEPAPPRYPLVHPSYARVTQPKEVADLAAEHIVHPVRWREAAGFALSQGTKTFIETGGVRVLSKFITWIEPETNALSIAEPGDLGLMNKLLDGVRDERA